MEKVNVHTQPRIIEMKFNSQRNFDYLYEDEFEFTTGCYGIISEQGLGAGGISYLLSGEKVIQKEEVFYNNIRIETTNFSYGWYVGNYKTLNLIDRESNVKQLLKKYVSESNDYDDIEEVAEEFGITNSLYKSKIYNCGWQSWRISLALGVCKNKKVFCFPYLNTAYLCDIMTSASVYRCIDILKEKNKIIVIPTSKVENLVPIIDNAIILKNPKAYANMADNVNIKEYFLQKYKY